jgi:hypothetical protein
MHMMKMEMALIYLLPAAAGKAIADFDELGREMVEPFKVRLRKRSCYNRPSCEAWSSTWQEDQNPYG